MPRFRRSGAKRAVQTIALLFALLFGGIIGANSPFANADTAIDDTEAWSTFEQVWQILMDEYVDPESLDPEALMYGAITGMVEAVGDTGHTRFIDPEVAALSDTDLEGEYIGIGITIDSTNARPVVAGVFEGSPADAAGIEIGDVIREVNGIDVFGMRTEEVNEAFQSPIDEPVELVLQRGDEEPVEVSILREAIEIDEVTWWMIDDNVAHISFTSFVEGSAAEVEKAVDEAIDAGAEYFILDLRYNGGGLITELLDVVALFLPTGTPVQNLEYRDGTTERLTVRNGTEFEYPMVILTNRSTGSAAEVTTAAINEAGVATVIGEVTSGTGTGLANQEFEDGSHLSYGVVLWTTPSGESIWKVGYEPDIDVELDNVIDRVVPEDGNSTTSTEIDSGADLQLQAALDFLLGDD